MGNLHETISNLCAKKNVSVAYGVIMLGGLGGCAETSGSGGAS